MSMTAWAGWEHKVSRLFKIGLLVALILISAQRNAWSTGVSGPVVEVRNHISVFLHEFPEPEPVISRYIKDIFDDEVPIAANSIISALKEFPAHPTRETEFRSVALQMMWIYRFRQTPGRLLDLYRRLSREQGRTYFFLCSEMLRPVVGPTHFVLGEAALQDVVKWSEDVLPDRMLEGSFSGYCGEIVRFLCQTKNPRVSGLILRVLQREIVDPKLRINIVSSSLQLGADAMPVARWYFDEYCFSSGQIEMFAKYFQTYATPEETRAFLMQKSMVLRDALAKLPDDLAHK